MTSLQVAAAQAADVVVIALGENHYAERMGDIDGAARARTWGVGITCMFTRAWAAS